MGRTYKIIETGCHAALSKAVNQEMANGWKPTGGVAIKPWTKKYFLNEKYVKDESGYNYLQALIREEE